MIVKFYEYEADPKLVKLYNDAVMAARLLIVGNQRTEPPSFIPTINYSGQHSRSAMG